MMNEYNCLIVDDEPQAQKVLELYLKDIPMLKLAGKCANVFTAMSSLQNNKIDIMFLDINMPKMSGLDFLKTLTSPPVVIITTAYREYALEGFELDATDYLKKPFSFERFLKAVNKAIEKINSRKNQSAISLQSNPEENNFIFIREDRINYKLEINKILFIEAIGDYIKIFTPEKTYLTYLSLKKIAEMLPAGNFIRVHKSFVVSTDKIKLIDGNLININNKSIPIGQAYRKEVMEKLGIK